MDPFPDREAVTRELARGLDLVSQLRAVARGLVTGGRCEPVDALVDEISRCFTRVLTVLSSREAPVAHLDPESTFSTPMSSKNTRQEGAYGRMFKISDNRCWDASIRKRGYSSAQKVIPATELEDGHIWKKYGQKKITGAKYPRSYFKCGQKEHRGCQATRQVQRVQDEPPIFLVTYIGHHTCTNALHSSQRSPDVPSPLENCMLSFELDRSKIHQVNCWSSPEEVLLPMFPTFRESSQATSSQKSPMEMSYEAPPVPTTVGLLEPIWFPTERPGCSNVQQRQQGLNPKLAEVGYMNSFPPSCSNVVPDMLSPPGHQGTDMDSFRGLLESIAGLCSDKGVGCEHNEVKGDDFT